MRDRKLLHVVPLLLIMAVAVGCLHKAGGAKPSAWERVMSENAVFSQLVHDSAAGIIQVQNAGLVSAGDVRGTLDYLENAAKVHQQVDTILALGPDAAAGSTQLDALLNQVVTAGQGIVNSGAAGVKNPKTQQTVSQDIQQLMGLAKSILHDVQAARTKTSSGAIRLGLSFDAWIPLHGEGVPPRVRRADILLAGTAGMPLSSPAGIAALIEALLALGPLAVVTFLKIQSYLNLSPDEKQNVADLLAASNANDAETIAMVEKWKQDQGFSTAAPPAPPITPSS